MSDTPDPFAARPYVPPSDRTDQTTDEAQDDAGAGEGAAAKETPAEAAAAPSDARAEESSPDKPAADDQSAADSPYTHRFEPAQPGASSEPSASTPTAASIAAESAGDAVSTVILPPTAAAAAEQVSGAHPAHHTGGTVHHAGKGRPGRTLAGAVAVALLGGAAGLGGGAAYEEYLAPDRGAISSIDLAPDTGRAPTGPVEQVAARVLPTVAQINVSNDGKAGSGTGIIISSDGQILTNNHVVEVAADGGTIRVAFSDGTNAKAKILGRDPITDIAVIKADNKAGLAPAVLGTSGNLRVGQQVVAVGSPFGLESTVTAGIISALNRPVASADSEGSHETIFPGIQTDAAINPGNSGGPLVDLQGRVVGINSAIRSNGGLEGGSIGLGFAIPIDLAKSVAGHLVKGEKVQHARIGVVVSPAVAEDEITTTGAEIKEVTPGSAGAKAGLQKGDVITAVNNTPVGSSDALVAAIRAYQPGQTVTITYLRGKEKKTVKVELDSDGGKLSP